jgi:hypothetical protein
MSAPRRLLEDPAVSDALRDDLRVAVQAEPAYDADRGLRALQAAVVALGPAAPLADGVSQAASGATQAASEAAAASNAGAGALATAGGKLGIAAVAAVVGLGAIGSMTWTNRAPVAPDARPTRAAPALVPRAPTPAPAPLAPTPALVPAPIEPSPTAAPPAPSARDAHLPARADHATSALTDSDLALRREIDHLARVKALLERDPRAAYALAQQGNRSLSSMFRQERDGLSVLALDAAGEPRRARVLARRFLIRHPSSPLRERIEAIAEPPAEAR